MKDKNTTHDQAVFDTFSAQEHLNPDSAKKFKRYLDELLVWNTRINLTAITDVQEVLAYHFQDSLRIREYIDFNNIQMIADVGSGAGFPGIPLKIVFPHLSLVLIEVNHKKITFLETMVEVLSLNNVEICPLDWRTFLRKTGYPISLFCARASLAPIELLRMFGSKCAYNNAQLIYWASTQWKPSPKEELSIQREVLYRIKNKNRKFVFFQKGEEKKGSYDQ